MSLPENQPEKVVDFFEGVKGTGKEIRVPEFTCQEFQEWTIGVLKAGIIDPDLSNDIKLQMESLSQGYHAFECPENKCQLVFNLFNQVRLTGESLDPVELDKNLRFFEED